MADEPKVIMSSIKDVLCHKHGYPRPFLTPIRAVRDNMWSWVEENSIVKSNIRFWGQSNRHRFIWLYSCLVTCIVWKVMETYGHWLIVPWTLGPNISDQENVETKLLCSALLSTIVETVTASLDKDWKTWLLNDLKPIKIQSGDWGENLVDKGLSHELKDLSLMPQNSCENPEHSSS